MPIHLLPPWWRPCCSASRSFSACMISSQDAEAVDLRHLLGRQIGFGDQPQPFFRDFGADLLAAGRDQALEHFGEHPVEPVELALVMNEGGAGEIIELLGLGGDHLGVHRFEQQQMLLQRGGNAPAAQRFDKADEHVRRLSAARRRAESPPGAWLTRALALGR